MQKISLSTRSDFILEVLSRKTDICTEYSHGILQHRPKTTMDTVLLIVEFHRIIFRGLHTESFGSTTSKKSIIAVKLYSQFKSRVQVQHNNVISEAAEMPRCRDTEIPRYQEQRRDVCKLECSPLVDLGTALKLLSRIQTGPNMRYSRIVTLVRGFLQRKQYYSSDVCYEARIMNYFQHSAVFHVREAVAHRPVGRKGTAATQICSTSLDMHVSSARNLHDCIHQQSRYRPQPDRARGQCQNLCPRFPGKP